MTTHIILTLVLLLLSTNAIKFLLIYRRLLLSGIKTTGKVVAYDSLKHLMVRNAAVPRISFRVTYGEERIGKPVHSWYIELNNYQLSKEYTLYYERNNPGRFVCKSNIELIVNCVLVAGALMFLAILITRLVR